MWEHKADLIEQRDGELAEVTLICPRVEEFEPLVEAATAAGGAARERGNFVLVEAEGGLRLDRPASVPEAVWWGAGTGGVKGRIATFDEKLLAIEAR
jgi:hypothetical protein